MAYGTSADVTLLLGGVDTAYFTVANMNIAIVMSDIWVDVINSSASSAKKTLASNIIAAEIMKRGRVTNKLKGLTSDGGTAGRPSRTGSYPDYIPKEALVLLQSKPTSSFPVHSPSVSGEWTS